MNAVTFFKSMGLKAVKQYLENDNIRTKEMHDELKQIVEAWELVESKGGLVECKKILSRDNFTWCSGGSAYGNPLERAINLVEQCQ